MLFLVRRNVTYYTIYEKSLIRRRKYISHTLLKHKFKFSSQFKGRSHLKASKKIKWPSQPHFLVCLVVASADRTCRMCESRNGNASFFNIDVLKHYHSFKTLSYILNIISVLRHLNILLNEPRVFISKHLRSRSV